MKNKAIIRIILWSIVIVLLGSTLTGGLIYRGYRQSGRPVAASPAQMYSPDTEGNENPDPSVPTQKPASEESFSHNDTGAAVRTYSPDSIRELKIQWAVGNIILRAQKDISDIQIMESGNSKYITDYRQSGNSLSISFSKEPIKISGITIHEDHKKDLTILVPRAWVCSELEIEAASVDLTFEDMIIREMDFDGAGGSCNFTNCSVDSLDMDTASGDIYFTGKLNTLDLDAASASFYGMLENTPNRIDVDSMSGDLELTLPEDTGFTVTMDGMNSQFTSDFQTTVSNGKYTYGDGRCRISMDAMSGDITIRKAA